MEVIIRSIFVAENRRKIDIDKVRDIADSIKEIGLLNPITIDTDFKLIAGAHRIEAYKALGLDRIEANIIRLDGLRAELAEIDENLIRNELHYLERGEQFKRRKEIYEELYPETKARNITGHKSNYKTSVTDSVAEVNKPSFAKDTTGKTGISQTIIREEIQIAKNLTPTAKEAVIKAGLPKIEALKIARLKPEEQKPIAEKIVKGEAKTVAEAIRETKREKIVESLNNIEPGALKDRADLYNVIYADPPWRYDFSQSKSREIENQYPTMSLEEMKELNIPSEENAVLFLWATAPKLADALEIIKAWGFIYKTCAVWDKEKIGMGYWFRNQHELLLVAVKGSFSPPAPENRISSVFRETRTEHSKKPNIFCQAIETMFPDCAYLELFARSKANEKWTVWGNQIE